MIEWSQTYGCWGQPCMAKTRECCGALSLRRTGDDLHVSLHKGFKIRLAGIVRVFIEFTGLVRLAGLKPAFGTRYESPRDFIHSNSVQLSYLLFSIDSHPSLRRSKESRNYPDTNSWLYTNSHGHWIFVLPRASTVKVSLQTLVDQLSSTRILVW